MSMQAVFDAALLRYIQANVDQLAEDIRDLATRQDHCTCGEDDWTCMCDTSMSMVVEYAVPREVDRFRYRQWRYYGTFHELIRLLDDQEETQ